METRRLEFLVELARYGSMRAVAERLNTTTSNVSQQIANLSRQVQTPLVEPHGRRIRLTSAGRRLADHAVGILAAVDAAQTDLDPAAEPSGVIRVAGFATAIRHVLLPTAAEIAHTHPSVELMIAEHEPAEAVDLLMLDRTDIALTYDYNLAPIQIDQTLAAQPLWTTPWSLGVPDGTAPPSSQDDAASVLRRFRHHDWIGNSRNTADEQVLRTLAAMADFTLKITHRADSLDLVEDLIGAGLGIGLLPADRKTPPSVRLLPLTNPPVLLRANLLNRRGQQTWPPLALLRNRITANSVKVGGA